MSLERLEPIGLEELDAAVALRTREDRKHIVAVADLPRLYAQLAGSHRVLELDGRRAFAYDSVYFDTADLASLHAHVQRRRRRFKCRTRLYVESGACAFEVKVRGARGQTVKHRLAHAPDDHGRLTPAARSFLAAHVDDPGDLEPTVRTTYSRTTLASAGERVTVDLGLSFGTAAIDGRWAVVETKSARGGGDAERVLRRLGSRPLSLSKYVMGAGLTRLPSPPNDLRLIARRYFAHA